MKKSFILFFQAVIVLLSILAITFLLWEPHLEGRNANATLFEIYFKDPFLAYAYIASIPFFIAHYKAFRVLGYAGQDKFFSQQTLKALRIIKFCAVAIICFVVAGEIFIITSISDDIAGGVIMGILITLGAIVVGISAAVFEKKLQKANI
ncbi:MAG: DUF2975 domain-containing protein [Bacteroidales bacterium]|nr:DUF2975 domain-containing protein [Bacteroidales bacterium]